jgi:hypothetical protein
MASFYKTSTLWVVDFHYQGRARRWFKALRAEDDPPQQMAALLHELYGERAQLGEVRPATEAEEQQYLRGEQPLNLYCPTGVPGGHAGES